MRRIRRSEFVLEDSLEKYASLFSTDKVVIVRGTGITTDIKLTVVSTVDRRGNMVEQVSSNGSARKCNVVGLSSSC